MRKFALLAIAAASLAACGPIQNQSQLTTPVGQQTAYPGSTVMMFRATKSLPTPFGGADPWGRTKFAGGTGVLYTGTQDGVAVFEGLTVNVESNKSTLTETPLLMPNIEKTNVSTTVNGQPVYGTVTTMSSTYIPPRPTQEWIAGRNTFRFTLGAGQSRQIEGRQLTVINVWPHAIEYRVE